MLCVCESFSLNLYNLNNESNAVFIVAITFRAVFCFGLHILLFARFIVYLCLAVQRILSMTKILIKIIFFGSIIMLL